MKKITPFYGLFAFLLLFVSTLSWGQANQWVKDNYTKYVYKIPMTDGTLLHTHVYVPKDASESNTYPMIMQRTCYSVAPYGEDTYPAKLGPSEHLMKEKYIFVYQDVRGRYMSEGTFTNMTPQVDHKTKKDVDESTDTYDTIDWLIKNIENNNIKPKPKQQTFW